MATDINEARSAFEDGNDNDSAKKWRERAKQRSGDYEDEFAPILADQNECSEETADQQGYDRLMAYSDCIESKVDPGNGGKDK